MSNELNSLDIKEIMDLLPHRYPFLLIDRVIDYVPGKTLHGIKNVSFNEPQFTGHFPGTPVFPGVMILEALAQATGERFGSQLKAYRVAKEIYKQEQISAVLEEALENIRKYVVVADQNDTQVFIFDAQEKLTPSLYELSGFQESNKK